MNLNPIIQALNPLKKPQNEPLSIFQALRNPEQAARAMMANNPQFEAFCRENQGKTPEQIAKAYGIDLNQIKSLIK